MKTTLVLLLSAALCAGAVQAETTKHVQIRVHKASPAQADKVHIKHGKFTVLDIGQQCAHDPKNDPSMYPCRDGGVCIRTSPTFGKCFSKEEAARLQTNATQSVDGSEDSDDDSDDSESGSGSGSASRAHGPEVGDEEEEDEEESADDDADDEEDDEEDDDSVVIATKPPAAKKA